MLWCTGRQTSKPPENTQKPVMLSKYNKYNTFTIIPNSFANSKGALLARGHVWPERPPAARWTTSDSLQLKAVFPSTRNDMFWKNLAFRLDETPTSELGFSGHELGRQKNISKTQGFSTIFWPAEIHVIIWAPPAALQNPKITIFLNKTICFGAKIKKIQCFFILLEAFGLFCVCQINHKGLDGFRFFLAGATDRIRNQIVQRRSEIGQN